MILLTNWCSLKNICWIEIFRSIKRAIQNEWFSAENPAGKNIDSNWMLHETDVSWHHCMQDVLLLSNTALLQYCQCRRNAAKRDQRTNRPCGWQNVQPWLKLECLQRAALLKRFYLWSQQLFSVSAVFHPHLLRYIAFILFQKLVDGLLAISSLKNK